MPIFEFRCRECGKTFERLVRSSKEAVDCPSCASPKLAKLLSVPSAPRTAAAAAPAVGGGGSGGCCGGGGCGCHN